MEHLSLYRDALNRQDAPYLRELLKEGRLLKEADSRLRKEKS